jgi:hypothetical protein
MVRRMRGVVDEKRVARFVARQNAGDREGARIADRGSASSPAITNSIG